MMAETHGSDLPSFPSAIHPAVKPKEGRSWGCRIHTGALRRSLIGSWGSRCICGTRRNHGPVRCREASGLPRCAARGYASRSTLRLRAGRVPSRSRFAAPRAPKSSPTRLISRSPGTSDRTAEKPRSGGNFPRQRRTGRWPGAHLPESPRPATTPRANGPFVPIDRSNGPFTRKLQRGARGRSPGFRLRSFAGPVRVPASGPPPTAARRRGKRPAAPVS